MQPQQQGATGPLTLEDPVAEAERIIEAARREGLTLRLLGGVAIRLRSPQAAHRSLSRSYADLDFAARKRQSRPLRDLLEANGYTADRRFNALHGEKRLLLFDIARERQLDIFLDNFEMCHKLPLQDRLEQHPLTLSPADLLLTKLQIVELNEKDVRDVLALLLDFPPETSPTNPGEALDVSAIARLAAKDWGWYTTLGDNLQKVADLAGEILPPAEAATVRARVAAMKAAMEREPKSLGWRARDKVGRRVPWYELPEEVRR